MKYDQGSHLSCRHIYAAYLKNKAKEATMLYTEANMFMVGVTVEKAINLLS